MHRKLVKRDIVQHSENHQTQFNDWGMKLQPSLSFMAHLEPVLTVNKVDGQAYVDRVYKK